MADDPNSLDYHPPMSDKTEHRHEYIKREIPDRFQKKKDAWMPNPAKLDDMSNYRKDYMEKKVVPRKLCKPDSNLICSEFPLSDKSTHRVDYQRWPYTKVQGFCPDCNLKPAGDMDMLSTNRVEFTEKPIQVRASCKPPPNRGALPKFVGSTECRDSYNKKEMAPILRQTMKSEFVPSIEPLENMTNYRMNYVGKIQPVRNSMKPCENDWGGDEPMERKTCYRHDYIKMPIPPRFERGLDKYMPNPAKLADKTVYRDHYAQKTVKPRKSCKPVSSMLQSDAPIQKATTQRVDYQAWNAKRPDLFNPEPNLFPEGDMDMQTSHRAFFTEKPINVRKPLKRMQRSLPGKFQGNTVYRHDYLDHKQPAPELMHGKSVFIPSEFPLADWTTYRGAFVPRAQEKRQLWIPTDNKRLLY